MTTRFSDAEVVGMAHNRGIPATHLPPKPRPFNSSAEIARTAPDFALPGIDGREHTLAEFSDADALVIIQMASNCPYVRAWEGRINAIHTDYSGRNVAVVGVNSNAPTIYLADLLPGMIERASEQGFEFTYLRDDDQTLARALGSTITPEVFVFDRDRKLAYHGMIDDSHDDTEVTQHYLRDALDAVLEGAPPPVADEPPRGCTLKWKMEPPTELDLSGLKNAIDEAFANGYPITLSYVDQDGLPQLSTEPSVQVLGTAQLALWEGVPDSDFLKSIAIRPDVTLLYLNLSDPWQHEGHIAYKFRGRARIDTSLNDTIYSNLTYAEATHDPDKKGVAVVIDVDSAQGVVRWSPAGAGRLNMVR